MLPGDHTLTDPYIPADFQWRMRSAADPLTDYEQGGAALNQAGDSLRAQSWTLSYADPDVIVTDAIGNATVLFSRAGITELALAFDQNMRPFVAFVENGQARFWWFDTDAGAQVFDDLPADATSPRACLDDHRATELASSDIILAYARVGDLYYRQQRDRFATEYQLTGGTTGAAMPCGGLMGVGMNKVSRLQFAFGGS